VNKIIQDDLLNYFPGSTSDGFHPSWIIVGGIVVGIGDVIALIFWYI